MLANFEGRCGRLNAVECHGHETVALRICIVCLLLHSMVSAETGYERLVIARSGATVHMSALEKVGATAIPLRLGMTG